MALLFAFADNLNNSDLEQLKGKHKGQNSIRINNQFRICFVWEKGKIYELELVDYHDESKQ